MSCTRDGTSGAGGNVQCKTAQEHCEFYNDGIKNRFYGLASAAAFLTFMPFLLCINK